MEPLEQLGMTTSGLRDLVAGTRADQLGEATPCAEWAVRDLINHIVGGGHFFAAGFRGESAMPTMGDHLGNDPTAAFDASVEEFTASVNAPGALDGLVKLPFGEMPAPVVIQLVTMDLTIHSWDLATATGQPFAPDEDLVAGLEQFAQMAIQPQMRAQQPGAPAGMQGPRFAEPIEPTAGATALERLIMFSGRTF